MKTAAHPLSGKPAAKATVVAYVKLEAVSNDVEAFPRVTAHALRIFRELAEDAVSSSPRGCLAADLSVDLRIVPSQLNLALHALPGLLAIYAPETVRVERIALAGQGKQFLYRLRPNS